MSHPIPPELAPSGSQSEKFFQQGPIPPQPGIHFLPQRQGGPQYNPNFMARFAVRSNPYMAGGCYPQVPLQHTHSSHLNTQYQRMPHDINNSVGQCDNSVNFYQNFYNACSGPSGVDGNYVYYNPNSNNANLYQHKMQPHQNIQHMNYQMHGPNPSLGPSLPNSSNVIQAQQVMQLNTRSKIENEMIENEGQCATEENSSIKNISVKSESSNEDINLKQNFSHQNISNQLNVSSLSQNASCDSIRPETAESTCSTLSSDSIRENYSVDQNINNTKFINMPNSNSSIDNLITGSSENCQPNSVHFYQQQVQINQQNITNIISKEKFVDSCQQVVQQKVPDENCPNQNYVHSYPPHSIQNIRHCLPNGMQFHPQSFTHLKPHQDIQNLHMNIPSETQCSRVQFYNNPPVPLAVVPFGWKRFSSNNKVVYVSPCGSELHNFSEVCSYLTRENTCKCGLQCPLRVENTFCFDPKVPHRLTLPSELSSNDASKSCFHMRKLAVAFSKHIHKQANRDEMCRKRKLDEFQSSDALSPSTPQNQMQACPPPFNQMQACQPPYNQISACPPPLQGCQPTPYNFMQHFPSQAHPGPMQNDHNPQNQEWNGYVGPKSAQFYNVEMFGNSSDKMNQPNVQNYQNSPCAIPPNADESHFSGNFVRAPLMNPGLKHRMNVVNRLPFYRMPMDNMVRGPMPNMQLPPHHEMHNNPHHQYFMNQQMQFNRMVAPHMPINPMYRMPDANQNVNPNIMAGPNMMGALPKSQDEKVPPSRRRLPRSKKRNRVDKSNSRNSTPDSVKLRHEISNSLHTGPGPPFERHSGDDNKSVSTPSFMEDPNAYLAQQTVLLNNTMSGGLIGQFSPKDEKFAPPSIVSENASSQKPETPSPVPKTIADDSGSVISLPSSVTLPVEISKPTKNIVAPKCVVTTSNNNFPNHSNQTITTISSNVNSIPKINPDKSMVKFEEVKVRPDTVASTPQNVPSSHSSQYIESKPIKFRRESADIKNETDEDKNMERRKEREIDRNTPLLPHSKRLDSMSDCRSISSRCSSIGSTVGSLSAEAANRPLSPGPAEDTMTTQSPLEMVQNIVSSIPVPPDSEPPSSRPGSKSVSNQNSQAHLDALAMQRPPQVFGTQLYNVNGANVTGLVYNASDGTNILRGATGPLIVQGTSGSVPQVLVSNSNNVVVVTSAFNSRMNTTTVGSNALTPIAPVVNIQTVPQIQVQSNTIANHQIAQQISQVPQIQSVVQFVNPFQTVQAPVIIQNGNGLIQSQGSVISRAGGIIAPTSILHSTGPTLVAGQQLLTVDGSNSQIQVAKVPASQSTSAGLSPKTPTSTPPHSTLGSETPPSGGSNGSSGGGRKRKRKRTSSTPQNIQPYPSQPQNVGTPTIFMGKQMSPQVIMNGAQFSQVAPYQPSQMATVATLGPQGNAQNISPGQVIANTQPGNSINLVQMVNNTIGAPLPVQVQQPQTIFLPSNVPTTGLIINQLPDGTFISTDPNTGISYPVQLQLSGSQIVGVTPLNNSVPTANVVGSLAVRQPQNSIINTGAGISVQTSGLNATAKIINISPNQTNTSLMSNIINVPVTTLPRAVASIPQSIQDSVVRQPLILTDANTTVLQRKTTTIVARRTTVVSTQDLGTHSSVSTQTQQGLIQGDSDVTSSDCIGKVGISTPLVIISPSHQSAEVTTTRLDEDPASTPESVLISPTNGQNNGESSPESNNKPRNKRLESHVAANTVWL